MASSLRELRERRASVAATMKITKAMELIAASRVTKAQNKARNAQEYTYELHRAVGAVAAFADVDHPLTNEHRERVRSAVLVISSDRGLAGGYVSNVVRAAEGLVRKLTDEGVEVDLYTTGRKARDYFTFHGRELAGSWAGFSDAPHYEHAREIGEALMERFTTSQDEGGVSELHVVYTHLHSMVSQKPQIVRLLPLQVVDDDPEDYAAAAEKNLDHVPDYDFEPDPETVLDALLPMYIIDTIKFMLRQASASELASRQQAMHAATDNAKDLIDQLTREANSARQAEITQEITEIVGGASALSESAQEER